MFPGTVHAKLRTNAPQPIEPSKPARAKVVALAIECSKPEAMNASSAHHSTARQNSWGPAAASLEVAIDATRSWTGPTAVPPACTRPANTIEPAMLPANEATRTASTLTGDVVPRHQPCSMTMTLPVNSSAPAKTTRVRAMPNTPPCTSLAAGDSAATSGALTDSSSTMATPTYAPARADDSR